MGSCLSFQLSFLQRLFAYPPPLQNFKSDSPWHDKNRSLFLSLFFLPPQSQLCTKAWSLQTELLRMWEG